MDSHIPYSRGIFGLAILSGRCRRFQELDLGQDELEELAAEAAEASTFWAHGAGCICLRD